jgi:tetratricopeptide (TPR) repeat protein
LQPHEFIFSINYSLALVDLDQHAKAEIPLKDAITSLQKQDVTSADCNLELLGYAHQLLGMVYLRTNKHVQALAAFESEIAALQSNPAPTDKWASSIAWAHSNMGSCFASQDLTEQADKEFSKAAALSRALPQPGLALNLFYTLYNRAVHYQQTARLKEACEQVIEALSVLEKSDFDAKIRDATVDANRLLGMCYADLNRQVDADATVTFILETTRGQRSMTCRSARASAYQIRACLSKENEQEASYRESISILSELARERPARYRPSLAETTAQLGQLICKQGKAPEGEEMLNVALSILLPFYNENPSEHGDATAFIYIALGDMHNTAENFGRAEVAYEQALDASRNSRPKADLSHLRRRARPLVALRDLLKASNRIERAERRCEELVEVLRPLAAQGDLSFCQNLALALLWMADVHRNDELLELPDRSYAVATDALLIAADLREPRGAAGIAGGLEEAANFFKARENWPEACRALAGAACLLEMLTNELPPGHTELTPLSTWLRLSFNIRLYNVMDELAACQRKSGNVGAACATLEKVIAGWSMLHDAHQLNVTHYLADSRFALASIHDALDESRDALTQYERAVTELSAVGHSTEIDLTGRLVTAHWRMGTRLRRTGQLAESQVAYDNAYKFLRSQSKTDDSAYWNLALLLSDMVDLDVDKADWLQAKNHAEQGVQILRSKEFSSETPRCALAFAYYDLGRAHREMGEREQAVTAYEQAVSVFRELETYSHIRGNLLLPKGLLHLGRAYRRMQRGSSAKNALQEASRITQQLTPDGGVIGLSLESAISEELAELSLDLGNEEGAQNISLERVAVERRLFIQEPDEYRSSLGYALSAAIDVLSRRKLWDQAENLCREHLILFESDVMRQSNSLTILAWIYCETDRHVEAASLLEQAIAARTEKYHSDPTKFGARLAETLVVSSQVSVSAKRLSEARKLLDRATELCQPAIADAKLSRGWIGGILLDIAKGYSNIAEIETAKTAYRTASDCFRQAFQLDQLRHAASLIEVLEQFSKIAQVSQEQDDMHRELELARNRLNLARSA